ncbi:hypothetical protein Tco_0438969 [Tanacetum coccineum]
MNLRLVSLGDAPIFNGFYLGWFPMNAFTTNHVTEKLQSSECPILEPSVGDKPDLSQCTSGNDPSFFLTNKDGAPQVWELSIQVQQPVPNPKWKLTCRVGGRPDMSSGNANNLLGIHIDRLLEGTGSSVGTAEGSAGARCSSSSSSSSSFSTSSSSLSSSDDSLS